MFNFCLLLAIMMFPSLAARTAKKPRRVFSWPHKGKETGESALLRSMLGSLVAGDIAVMDERGYLRITDRIKDMFIMGGFNVYPAEVEQSLMRLEGLADVAVVGVPDERMGEVGKAFVVRADSPAGEALTADDVTAFAREHLANFKVPRQVEFTGALPRNLSGKVLKKDLR